MAMCEKCNKGGWSPDAMFVEFNTFIGPCCAKPDSTRVRLQPVQVGQVVQLAPNPQDLDYGMEVSNKVGVRAWVNYQGLQLSYEKSPKQIKEWAEKNGLVGT